MGIPVDVIPLVHPNNFRWVASEKKLECLPGLDRTKLVVNVEALKILNDIKEPVAPLAIMGQSGIGKSFFMSQLQDNVEFVVGDKDSRMSTTVGIWMATSPLTLEIDGRPVRVLLLDSEGSLAGSSSDGQNNDRFDLQIASLVAILSSVLIYFSDRPASNHVDILHSIANISKNSTGCNFKQHAPDLVWIVRNTEDSPESLKEYLEENVLMIGGRHVAVGQQRTKLGDVIMSYFRSFDTFGLPYPLDSTRLLNRLGDPEVNRLLEPEYTFQLAAAKAFLWKKIQPKTFPNSKTTNGHLLGKLFLTHVKLLNEEGTVPKWTSTWDAAAKLHVDDVLQLVNTKLLNDTRVVMESSPMSKEEFDEAMDQAFEDAMGLFKSKTESHSGSATFKKAQESLRQTATGNRLEKEKTNALKLKKKIKNDKIATVVEEIQKQVASWNPDGYKDFKEATLKECEKLKKSQKDVNISKTTGASAGVVAGGIGIAGGVLTCIPVTMPIGIILDIVAISISASAITTEGGARIANHVIEKNSLTKFKEDLLIEAGIDIRKLSEFLTSVEFLMIDIIEDDVELDTPESRLKAVESTLITLVKSARIMRQVNKTAPDENVEEKIKELLSTLAPMLLTMFQKSIELSKSSGGMANAALLGVRGGAAAADGASDIAAWIARLTARAAATGAKVAAGLGIATGAIGVVASGFTIHECVKSFTAGSPSETAVQIEFFLGLADLMMLI